MREIPLSAIEEAARTIYDPVIRTPVVRLDWPRPAGSPSGAEIFLKLETLQPIGSFKIRGAQNVVRQLSASSTRKGVWTVSAGNAAQGVALAARLAGVPCSVMVTDTAPAAKIEAIERLAPEDGRIGLAVSGGPDSMAMLLLADLTIPGQFEVATINHGLRPESVEECALVALACAERDIPCTVLTVEVGQGNLQEQARVARYEALGAWAQDRGLTAVATAHHADDQAETLIMRLNRGSGLSGLAGVRPRTTIGVTAFIRPLLRFRRSELAKLVESSDLVFATDPSNENESFDRVRIRKVLAEADWLDPLAVARSAELLAEAEFYVSEALNRCWEASVQAGVPGPSALSSLASIWRSPSLTRSPPMPRKLPSLAASATRLPSAFTKAAYAS